MLYNYSNISTNSKLSAFTLIDVLAAIVILSIVISMAFYLMSAASKQSYEFQGTRLELNDFVLLNNDIKREVDQCQMIEEIPFGFILRSTDKAITYKKSERCLLREKDLIWDTLAKNCSRIEFIYLPQKEENASPIISDIEIVTSIQKQEFTSYFHKDYGISEPINAALIHEF